MDVQLITVKNILSSLSRLTDFVKLRGRFNFRSFGIYLLKNILALGLDTGTHTTNHGEPNLTLLYKINKQCHMWSKYTNNVVVAQVPDYTCRADGYVSLRLCFQPH